MRRATLFAAFSFTLAAAAEPQRPPRDLFGAPGSERCRSLDPGASDGEPALRRLASCIDALSLGWDIVLDIPGDSGSRITVYFLQEPGGDAARETRYLANLAYSLDRHLPGGTYAGRAIVIKTAASSGLIDNIESCFSDLDIEAQPLERFFELAAPCLKALPELGITDVRYDGDRLKIVSAAAPATRARLRGMLGFKPPLKGPLPPRPLFIDVSP